MARFLADEDFDQRIAAHLRQQGHEVLTLGVLGLAAKGRHDEEILALATDSTRAVLTHNRRHFIQLHRASAQHAGIVISSHARDPAAQATRIHEAIVLVSDLAGRLLRVNLAGHTME
jgi:hypothetical protein